MNKMLGLLIVLFPFFLSAQKVVQLETRGKAKTKKFTKGDELTYRLKDDDIWHPGVIEDVNPEAGYIIFSDRLIAVEQIEALKFYNNQEWSASFAKMLNKFALGWLVFGTADHLIFTSPERQISVALIIIPAATAALIGASLKSIFKQNIKKLGRRHRLRLLDLEVIPMKPSRA